MVDDSTPARQPGLRERKKQRTRELIAETARRLFSEQGFEPVTVAEIARQADVSVATVFNYFPTKEDLFYDRMEAFEEALLTAIRQRAPGESILDAFGSFMIERSRRSAESGFADRAATFARVIDDSPALLARERQIVAGYTEALTALIAEETGATGDDIEPRVAASALMGVHRALVDYVRKRALAGRASAKLGPEVEARFRDALALLSAGLGNYGIKQDG